MTFPYLKVVCYHCQKSGIVSHDGNVRTKGWTDSPRMVYGEEDRMFVFSRVYKCLSCSGKLYSHSPKFIMNLPYHVFNFNLT